MNRLKTLLFLSSTCLLVISGCGAEQGGKKVEPLCVSGGGKAEAMVAAEMVLGKMGFAISKSDFESGYISTQPLRTGQFFEFWRSDAVGEFNSAESNLHCIRRTAVIDVTEEAEQLCVGCEVSVERLSLSGPSSGSGSATYDKFPERRSLESFNLKSIDKDLRESRGAEWISLGGDPELAEAILKQIEEKIKVYKKESP